MKRPSPTERPGATRIQRTFGLDERSGLVDLGVGVAAAAAAGLCMLVLRSTLMVRSIPERMLEWVLLFVPLDVFEVFLARFGFSAKRYALYLGVVIMLGLLVWLGTAAMRRRWPMLMLLGVGIGLWLFTMLVIMPLTSAGVFATALFEGGRETVLGYLSVGLVYASVLALGRAFLVAPAPEASPSPMWAEGGLTPRRWALALMGGTTGLLAVTYVLDALFPHRSGLPGIVVIDPQEPVPSGGIDPPNPHPNVVPPSPVAVAPTAAPSVATQQPLPAATPSLPEPSVARSLTRDQDGAVLPSARRVGELTEAITSNENFYIVTKNAGGDPVLRPDQWRLVVDGEINRSFELDYAALRRLPTVEVTKTMECISNLVAQCELTPFGCDLISTARFKGVRLSDIFNLGGGVRPEAMFLTTISSDEYVAAIPMDLALSNDAVLVYEMNGQVLPREHGYPARILVPGRYGMKGAKWVVALRPVRREVLDWYGQRSWSREAIVKTMTRIDVPARDTRVPAGVQRVAGIAYAGDRGVQKVEYSADGGETWQVAEILEGPQGGDVWVRWQGRYTAVSGQEITLVARATDGTGALQIETFSLPQPDGASGWNSVRVRGA